MTLTLRDLTHDYGTGPVLHNVTFTVQPGQVHALLGVNGAGKSTLIHIATGMFAPTAGQIVIDDEPVAFAHPGQARHHGVVLLAQEVDRSLVPQLAVHENLTVAQRHGIGRRWWFSPRSDQRAARALLDRYGVKLDVTRQVSTLSLFEKQVLCLIRAVASNAKYLLLDEPTSSFDAEQVTRFYEIVRALIADGLGVVFISHRLNEVFELADEITVLRDGRKVLESAADQVTPAEVVEAMTGGDVAAVRRSERVSRGGDSLIEPVEIINVVSTSSTSVGEGATAFAARGFTIGRNHTSIDLELKSGEVLVVFGPLGSGKTSLARQLFALRGSYVAAVDGHEVTVKTPTDATRLGIALVPEERRRHGVWLDETVGTHLALGLNGWIRKRREARRSDELMADFDVQPRESGRIVRRLSGGNQQKVAFAKWGDDIHRVMVLDEPMTGVDVGAKESLFTRIEQAADAGTAVLYLTAEPDDALRIADRVLVLGDGEPRTVPARGLTPLDLMFSNEKEREV